MEMGPVLLSRYTQDVGFDTRALARYIGNLEQGRSKVSVNSALSVGDRADHFRLRTTGDEFVRVSTGELVGERGAGIEVAEDGTVRYQLISATGRIIADSDPDSGAEFEAWQALASDENLELGKGWYVLRVSRGREALDPKEYVYSFTLRSGVEPVPAAGPDIASREFLTTERPAPPGAELDRFAGVPSVLGLLVDVRVF
jgi:hypothetical protein